MSQELGYKALILVTEALEIREGVEHGASREHLFCESSEWIFVVKL